VLLPLGSPLPDDAVSAIRGQSGMLAGLSVPLSWGVAAPPHAPAAADGINQRSESHRWEAEAESRFDVPRISSAVPHSPAAG